MTLLAKIEVSGPVMIFRHDCYDSKKQFEKDFRGYGYRVLKVWCDNVSDAEVKKWLSENRKFSYGV